MKIQLIKSDNSVHNLTVGYTWDKGGYEKHYAIKDNDRKILFIHNGLACDALQEHKMLDFVRNCFGLGRITWNGFRLRFTKICHEDLLDKLVERGWKIVGDWDDNFNNFRIIEQ